MNEHKKATEKSMQARSKTSWNSFKLNLDQNLVKMRGSCVQLRCFFYGGDETWPFFKGELMERGKI